MTKLLTATATALAVLAGSASLAACDGDPADTPECKKWQAQYERTRAFDGTFTDVHGNEQTDVTGAILRSALLEERPDGCPIP